MADRAACIRLATALTLSAFLHLVLIFSPMIALLPQDPLQTGAQVVLQATLAPSAQAQATQAAQTARPAQKAPRQVRAGGSAKAAKASAEPEPRHTASVELGPPPNGGPQPAEHHPQSEPVRQQTDSETASAAQPAQEQLEASSAEPENREPTSIADPGAPAYPLEAIQRGLESCVLAAIYISALGEVEMVRILHADVPEVFDQSVIDAYQAARYLPAREHGKSLPGRVLAVISFVLKPDQIRNCALKYAPAARKVNALPVSASVGPEFVEDALHAAQ